MVTVANGAYGNREFRVAGAQRLRPDRDAACGQERNQVRYLKLKDTDLFNRRNNKNSVKTLFFTYSDYDTVV